MVSTSPIAVWPVKTRLFEGLDETVLRPIRRAAVIRHIGPNKPVTVAGEFPHSMFLLQSGRARFWYCDAKSGREITVILVTSGSVIGVVSILPNPPAYVLSASTITECEFLAWDHRTACGFAKAHPRIFENGFRIAIDALSVYRNRHLNAITENAESRLAGALLDLSTKIGKPEPSGIEVKVTNEQLGSLSDVGVFTTSRLLSKWERARQIEKHRGKITLRSPEHLIHEHHKSIISEQSVATVRS